MFNRLLVEVECNDFTHMDAVRVNNSLADCGLTLEDMKYVNDIVSLEISCEKDIEEEKIELIKSSVTDLVLGNYDVLPVSDGSYSLGSGDIMDNVECVGYNDQEQSYELT